VAFRLAGRPTGRWPATAGGRVPRLPGRDQILGVQARPGPRGRGAECLGGNGYVEESGLPRLYREPARSIWEGRATSQRSTRCAPWPGSQSARRFSPRSAGGRSRPASGPAGCPAPGRSWPILAAPGRGGSRKPCPWLRRASLLVRFGDRPSRTRSPRPGWTVTGAARSARCRPATGEPTHRSTWRAMPPFTARRTLRSGRVARRAAACRTRRPSHRPDGRR